MSEVCLGPGCDPYNEIAVNEFLRFKDHPVHKGLILMGGSSDQFEPLFRELNKVESRN